MRLIAKFYVSILKQWPSGGSQLELQAVCRGEENRSWAAATPAGNLTIPGHHPHGAAALAAFEAADGNPEVHVLVEPSAEGEWTFDGCQFAYAGVQVKFTRSKRPQGDHLPGELAMTVNNSSATQALREAFAEALVAGEPARFRVWTEPVDV